MRDEVIKLLWSSVKTAATPFGLSCGLFKAYAPETVAVWQFLAVLVLAAAGIASSSHAIRSDTAFLLL